ncbi:MAG: helix-turn-helix domain-containing protein [Thermoprotei archaeon]|nr:helix-turn-helix domain-containing protein [Thermoprotei archaeon]
MPTLPHFTTTERYILLHYLSGLSPKKTAEAVGCSVKTVYKAIYKYRKALREGFSEDELRLILSSPPRRSRSRVQPMLMPSVLTLPWAELMSLSSVIKELMMSIRSLNESISHIRKELTNLRLMLADIEASLNLLMEKEECARSTINEHKIVVQKDLPSYLVDNPWLEILAARA